MKFFSDAIAVIKGTLSWISKGSICTSRRQVWPITSYCPFFQEWCY